MFSNELYREWDKFSQICTYFGFAWENITIADLQSFQDATTVFYCCANKVTYYFNMGGAWVVFLFGLGKSYFTKMKFLYNFYLKVIIKCRRG